MSTFYTVTAGNQTLAADLNQFANYLNGTTSGGAVIVNGGAGASTPYAATLTALPGAGTTAPLYDSYVSGDTVSRFLVYVDSNGVPYIAFGSGTAALGNLYGISGGLKTDNNFTVLGTFTVSGGTTLSGVNISGNTSLNTLSASGAASFSGTANFTGQTTFSSNTKAGGEPLLTNASQAGTCQVFTGTGTPSGAVEGDLWFKG